MSDIDGYSDRDFLISIHTQIGLITNSIGDHENRVRKLEKDGYRLKGAGAVLTVLLGLIEPFVVWRHK